MSKPTSPLITVLVYAVCAIIWALTIDLLITLLNGHVDTKFLKWLLHYKGIVFALLSSVLLYGLLKRNQKKLETSEEAYIRMFRQNPQPMWIYHKKDFRFREVNDAAIQLYGYTRQEFLRMTILDIRPEDDVVRIREDAQLTTLPGYSSSGIWRHYKKDGSLMYVKIESFGITYHNEPAEVISIYDVTAAYQQLEEKNKLLMDVAFISSHRLRMPVASMLGLLAQMDTENLANPANLPYLRYIEKLVNDMDDMLHEMADKCNQIYSKSGSAKGV